MQLIGGYRDGLKFGEVITFDDQRFLEARSQKLRPFLYKILDLQLFRQFIDDRLISIKDGFSDEFEKEICLYSERVSKRKFKLLQNIKDKVIIFCLYLDSSDHVDCFVTKNVTKITTFVNSLAFI